MAAALCGPLLPTGGCTARAPLPDAATLMPASLQLTGQFSIPALTLFPPVSGVRFGGLSGLAPTATAGEFLAACDTHLGSRVFRIRLTGEGPSFRADPLATIPLEVGGRAPRVDPEGIAVTRRGDMWIASEGIAVQEPRVPAAIVRYSSSGTFLGQLELRERFIPNATGPLTRGLRDNAALEGIAITPSGRRLFVITETALAQDGGVVTFDNGTPARLLEYEADGDSFEPAREFVYPLDAMERVPFQAGLTVAGVVDLLALSETEFLTLERSYIEETGRRGQGLNRIRVFRTSIDGASDVSRVDSLKEAPSAVPVRKTLLLDLSAVQGLSADLAPTLDNFEAIVFGPRLADGRATLILVSDDNFSPNQRTWFLQFGVAERTEK